MQRDPQGPPHEGPPGHRAGRDSLQSLQDARWPSQGAAQQPRAIVSQRVQSQAQSSQAGGAGEK